MLRKIIAIRNIGRFKNSAAPGNPELAKHTLIVGANGYGKTTLCAVIRSLKTGDAAHIAGRRTLGTSDPATVDLLLADGAVKFDGANWSRTHPDIAIFDGAFVAENVHSGEAVEIDHRRNLYRVIIGEQGVRLAEEDTRLAGESREKTREITAAERAIQPHVPQGMNLQAFIDLPADPDIDARIAEQERTLEAVREAKQINDRGGMVEIDIPDFPEGFAPLLARTIEDIGRDAEALLADHLATHGMEADGGNWIATGLPHTDGETCPFCGQDISGLPLIAAYRAIFSDRYGQLRAEIEATRATIEEGFGEGALGRLGMRIEQNKSAIEFWNRYCAFDSNAVACPAELIDTIREAGRAASALLERKARAPLDPLQPGDDLSRALASYDAVREEMRQVNGAVRNVNALIEAKKAETGAADVAAAQAELARRRAIKARHSDPLAGLCADRERFRAEKEAIDKRKAEIRAELDQYTRNIIRPYERRINHYLDAFNAGFRIAETSHGYPGGTAASSYRIVINNTAIDLGDGRTPPDRPSFKNTLSAGDRTTLALAFFLAHLEQDQALAQKIVVFDDPFSSQDAFRRRQTVHEIAKVARNSAQVIVLSHDATFLKQVWDKAPAAERIALTLADHRSQGSKITLIDLDRACQGRTATDIDDLQAYLATGAGNLLDLIRKMRAVLETHCWTTYPASFQAGQDWLGEIARKIREGGDAHPARDLYDELDQINDYTSQYYHGEDVADATPDQIDPHELTGYVRRTLRIVNALQA